jgi:hypothetical protein
LDLDVRSVEVELEMETGVVIILELREKALSSVEVVREDAVQRLG